MKPHLVFVMPALDLAGDEHFIHATGLAEEVAETNLVDVTVVVLKPARQPWSSTSGVAVRYLSEQRLRRAAQLTGSLWSLRRGDAIFVRISTPALLVSLAMARMRGARVAYWLATWPGLIGLTDAAGLTWGKRSLLRKVDRLITYPQALASFYVYRCGARSEAIRLVPNNVSLEQLVQRPWPEGGSRHRLLFVGRLSERKGAHDLPAIAKELEAGGDSIVVAGAGPLNSRLESEPGLHLLGPTPNGEVLSLMQQADLLIMPSYAEGCSRVLQEACTLGLPLVAYDIPPVAEMLGDLQAECCVAAGQPAALARRVTEMVERPSESRAQLVHRLSVLAEAWRSVHVAQELLDAVFD